MGRRVLRRSMIRPEETTILRELARRLAELAADETNGERIRN